MAWLARPFVEHGVLTLDMPLVLLLMPPLDNAVAPLASAASSSALKRQYSSLMNLGKIPSFSHPFVIFRSRVKALSQATLNICAKFLYVRG
jgi:hypothetical protein